MSTNKTQNYQFHVWDAADNFLLSEINENTRRMDSAIGMRARMAAGTYTGDGKGSRTIYVGFTPKAVLLEARDGGRNSPGASYTGLGLAVAGNPVVQGGKNAIFVVAGGFQVAHSDQAANNKSGQVYHYLAVG